MRRAAINAAPPIPEGDQTSVGANPHGDAIFQRILRLCFFWGWVDGCWWVFWNDVSEGANGLIHNGTIICWYVLKLVSDSSSNCLLSFGLFFWNLLKMIMAVWSKLNGDCLGPVRNGPAPLDGEPIATWSESIRLINPPLIKCGNWKSLVFDGFFSWETCATHGGIFYIIPAENDQMWRACVVTLVSWLPAFLHGPGSKGVLPAKSCCRPCTDPDRSWASGEPQVVPNLTRCAMVDVVKYRIIRWSIRVRTYAVTTMVILYIILRTNIETSGNYIGMTFWTNIGTIGQLFWVIIILEVCWNILDQWLTLLSTPD